MKRTLNLLPAAEIRPVAVKKMLPAVLVVLAVYVVALAGVWFLNAYENRNIDSTITDLSGKKQQMQQHLAASAPAGKELAYDPAIMNKMRTTPPWDAVLSELSLIVPNEVWLEIIESPDSKHLRLKGYSNTQADVARLIERLERSRYFGNVEIVFAQKGATATTFELRTEMVWT